MIKLFRFLLCICFCVASPLSMATVKLGASPLATYVDNEGEPARLNTIVQTAFSRISEDVELSVMRRAFLGSALSAGQLDGEFAFISLDSRDSNLYYSEAYLPLRLFVGSKRPNVANITLIPQLQDSRIAVENRFANTDDIRKIREIKWSRNPSTYDAFKQFADNRAPFILTSELLLSDFNRLLITDNEEPVFLTPVPLLSKGFHLALKKSSDNLALIKKFDSVIAEMQKDGSFNEYLGVTWLQKDVDDDGVADYVTSDKVNHRLDERQFLKAFPLDDTKPGDASRFYVNGEAYPTFEKAKTALISAASAAPESFLDRDVYKKIIKQW